MGIEQELKNQGYRLEYEQNEGEDKKQVWMNDKAGMALRIEWIKIEKVRV